LPPAPAPSFCRRLLPRLLPPGPGLAPALNSCSGPLGSCSCPGPGSYPQALSLGPALGSCPKALSSVPTPRSCRSPFRRPCSRLLPPSAVPAPVPLLPPAPAPQILPQAPASQLLPPRLLPSAQLSFRAVAHILHSGCLSAAKSKPSCYSAVTQLLLSCCSFAAQLLLRCLSVVAQLLLSCCSVVTQLLLSCCSIVAQLELICCLVVA
jgi:hypothetical protein